MQTEGLASLDVHNGRRYLGAGIKRRIVGVYLHTIALALLKEAGGVDGYVARLQAVHCTNKPIVACTASLNDILAYLAIKSLALIPYSRTMLPEVELCLALVDIGQVVPIEEGNRTVIDNGHSQLMCLGVLNPAIEVAWGVVGWSAEETGEGKHGVVLGIRHLLVAAYALLCHKVGICAAPTSRTILVVDVYHDVVIGTLANGIVQPCGPLLRTYLNKAKLDAADTPLVIERKYAVKILIQSTLIDIHPYADALALGILAELWHIKIAVVCNFKCRRTHLHLGTIPSGIKLDVLQATVDTEVDCLHSRLHIQTAHTKSLAGTNPVGVRYLARGIEVEHHLLVVDKVDRLIAHHDVSPRHVVGCDDVGRIVH